MKFVQVTTLAVCTVYVKRYVGLQSQHVWSWFSQVGGFGLHWASGPVGRCGLPGANGPVGRCGLPGASGTVGRCGLPGASDTVV